jgi:hypothetical protein
MELLAIAVKRDREAIGLTQNEVDRRAAEYAREMDVRLTVYWCGQIERCVARSVPINERKLLAKCLEQPEDRYYGLETDPRKFIGRLLAKEPHKENLSVLERSIIFPPEYKQSGVAILSYFAEVVARKYPDDDVRVTILQSGPTVTLRIETPEGDIEEIERTLEQYGLVVTGQLPIDRFTDDRELIRDLKTRIEVTNLELKLRKEAFLDQKAQYEERVVSLEDQVQNLYSLVSTGLDHSTSLSAVIGSVASMGTCNARAAQSLETIARLMAQAQAPQNEAVLNDAFATVKKEAPSLYSRLLATLQSIPANIMANLATPWVQAFINSLPK